MQQSFDAMALALNMEGTQVPIAPDIAAKIRTLAFEMSDDDDLTTGLHPFAFGYLNPEEIAAACILQEQCMLVQQGQGAPTLSEAATFTRAGQTKLARALTEATISCGKWRIVLHVLLGGGHQMTTRFDTFWRNWNSGLNFLLNVRTRTPGLFPALTMRWVQLRTTLWFHQQSTQNANVEAPDFDALLSKVRLQELWEPAIPARCLAVPAPQTPQLPTLHQLPVQQPPPNLPGQPGGPPPGPLSRGALERKSSPLNQAFQPFVALALRVRDVLRRAGPSNRVPNNAAGTEMCLSCHIKGMCNANCARRADHRDHTPDEDNALLQWCQLHCTPE